MYRMRSISLLYSWLLLLCISCVARAQETADYFRQNCASCHTIGGGRLTGPDLKNATARKDREWLVKFIIDPKAVIESGDAYAAELLRDARGAVMPTLVGISRTRAEALVDLIAAESKLEKSQFVGLQLSERAFTQNDIDQGRRLFTGEAALVAGGPSCISCHTVHGIGGLGGGSLAPDLTAVFERYEGRKTLGAWLSSPATPTMQSVFKKQPLDPEEVLALTAFFQSTLQRTPENASTARLNFVLIGLGGALLSLSIFDVVWRRRFRAVRRPLVESSKAEIVHER